MKAITILIPTYNRLAALASTLTSLAFQQCKDFDICIADQSDQPVAEHATIATLRRLLERKHIALSIERNLPRRGIGQQRQFLLEQAATPYALFLDDDVILDDFAVRNMLDTLREHGCGFAGNAGIGLSYTGEVRPHEERIEFWEGRVLPEQVGPGSEQWQRYMLHNAANTHHVAARLGITPDSPRAYKVAWVGGCVLFDTAKLRDVGGFSFWERLPAESVGEDVVAQLRVMAKYGGCGVLPTGAYHQELPTTLPSRDVDAPHVLLGGKNAEPAAAHDG